jgi:hypothetical protein
VTEFDLSGITKDTMRISGFHAGPPTFPDVFARVSDWEGDDKYDDISQMRVGGIAQLGPDAHLVRSWKPGDDPLAVMDYEVVEEIEPGAFRLEARPS